MDPNERDMLIRIDQRMTDFTKVAEKFMTKAESEDGFARCQVHKTDMVNLDKSMGRIRKGIWGVATAIFGGIIALTINIFK